MGKQKYPSTTSISVDGVAVKRGRDNYSHAKADARQDKRRFEADARQLKYNDLTIVERQCLVRTRPGDSKRELARLAKLLAKEKAPQVKQAPLTSEQKGAKVVKTSKAAAAH